MLPKDFNLKFKNKTQDENTIKEFEEELYEITKFNLNNQISEEEYMDRTYSLNSIRDSMVNF